MYLIYVLVAIAALAGIYGIYVARRNAIERENDTRAEREVRELVDLHSKPTLWKRWLDLQRARGGWKIQNTRGNGMTPATGSPLFSNKRIAIATDFLESSRLA